jgi:hypothetical protein
MALAGAVIIPVIALFALWLSGFGFEYTTGLPCSAGPVPDNPHCLSVECRERTITFHQEQCREVTDDIGKGAWFDS